MSQRVRIDLSYDGTDFFGWQKQAAVGQPTVQGTLEACLEQLFGQPVRTLGAGRTDAGVHALHQVMHFDCPKPPKRYKLLSALNSMTPESIAIHRVFYAPTDFHALASSTGKIYRYLVLNRTTPSALRARYSLWERRRLDLDWLNEASSFLVGTHDFKSFQSQGTEVKSTVRQVRKAHWERQSGDLLVFTIEGEGFLKQMVRNIVGTLLEWQQKNRTPGQIKEVLSAQDRSAAGRTAPARGLFLSQVQYPESLDRKCQEI